MEMLGKGDPVPYARCVEASPGSRPNLHSRRTSASASPSCWAAAATHSESGGLLDAVDAWRRERVVPMASVRALGAAVIAHFDSLSAKNLQPYLPRELSRVPRANIEFLPIKDAWFSGSMNYIGRARNADGTPQYEATYEINASLQMSYPEFEQLVSHEVVPGHVTTFAYLQDLYVRGKAGFETTVLTMNTRAATLFEGIANNAILIAHGVTEVEQLPDEDLQIGVLLALLQDDAKNQSSYLTWGEGRPHRKWRPRCGAIFWSPKNAPINCPAHGDGIRCWAECISRRTARERRRWRNCGALTPPSACFRPSTAATDWWTSRQWMKCCAPRRCKSQHSCERRSFRDCAFGCICKGPWLRYRWGLLWIGQDVIWSSVYRGKSRGRPW